MASSNMYRNRYDSEVPPPYHPSSMRQWAVRVISFSSEYNNAGWSANQALGQPKVYPQHGDIQGAWATSVCDQNQFIELEFEIPVKPMAINIYETYNPGAVVCVKARDPNHQWTVLWRTASPTHFRASRIFSPPIPDLVSSLTINQLRIEIDCSAAGDWCEIDAVELVGIRPGAVGVPTQQPSKQVSQGFVTFSFTGLGCVTLISSVKPVDDSQYFEDMNLLINNKLLSDVELQIDNSTVYAHKAILAARSPFFAKMFKKGKEDKVNLKLPNVSKKDLIAAFTFLYINRLPQDCSTETLINLCKTAETFEIKDMKIAALYKLTEVISCDNVVNIFMSLEDDPSGDEIKSMCIKFMAENLKAMSHAPDFGNLPQKYLVEIVQNATVHLSMNN